MQNGDTGGASLGAFFKCRACSNAAQLHLQENQACNSKKMHRGGRTSRDLLIVSIRDPENSPEYSELLYLCGKHWRGVPRFP